MRKSENGGSRSGRSGGGRRRRALVLSRRDVSELLRAWAKTETLLRLSVNERTCGPSYVGRVFETSPSGYEFRRQGLMIRLTPSLWSHTRWESASLTARGNGGERVTIEEVRCDGPHTPPFRGVSDLLTKWSKLDVKVAVALFMGPCSLSLVSSVYANAPAGVFTFHGTDSLRGNVFLVVDIRQYDRMIVGTEDQFTTVVLTDLAQGFDLRISDDPMIHATIRGQFGAAGTA